MRPLTVGRIVGLYILSISGVGLLAIPIVLSTKKGGPILQTIGDTALKIVGALGPIVGAVVGSIIPGAGTAVGGAVGTGASAVALGALRVSDEDALELLKKLPKAIADDPETQQAVASVGTGIATQVVTKGKIDAKDAQAMTKSAGQELARQKMAKLQASTYPGETGIFGRALKVLPPFGIYRSIRYLATGKPYEAPLWGKAKRVSKKGMMYKARCWACGEIKTINVSEQKKLREALKYGGPFKCPKCGKKQMSLID